MVKIILTLPPHQRVLTMGPNPNFFNPSYTSNALEHNVISRFRQKLAIIPDHCEIERQIWGNTTSLVLDFHQCPHYLAPCQDHIALIGTIAKDLGLSSTIVLRLGHKILHWQTITPPDASANL